VRRLLPLAVLALISAAPRPVSDPIGVYALIDRVVLEPNADHPSTIQIWGVFALSPRRPGNEYQPAQRGYLYYSVNRKNDHATHAEWSDLKAVAATGQPVGFGGRYEDNGRVRRAGEAATNPDTYPLGFGLVKMLNKLEGPTIERELKHVPMPVTPADGASARAGQVRLVARNVATGDVQYVFDIEGSSSTRETSQPITAGKGETSWSPQMRLRSGENYVWRVWVVQDGWRGQPAVASFRVE
jgi:hypothetical protein